MKDLIRLIGWVLPYKGRLASAIACSLIAVICLTAVVVLIKPVLEMSQPGAGVPAVPERGTVPAPAKTGEAGGPEDLKARFDSWIDGIRQSAEESLHLPAFKAWLAERPYTRLPLLIVVLALLKGIFGFLAEYQIRWVGMRLIADLRGDLYDRILIQSARFFTRNTTGQLMSRVLGDVGKLQKITSTNFADFVRLSFTIVAFVIVVFYISLPLSLLCLVGLPVLVYPVVRLSRRLKKASRTSQARAADLSHLLSETIAANRIVKGFGMERFESGRFRSALKRMFRADVKAIRTMALTPPILELVGAAYLAALLAYAGMLMGRGALSPSDLFPFVVGLGVIFISVKKLSLMNNDLQQALAAARRVFEVYDADNEVKQAPNALEVPSFSGQIEFRGVGFRYDDMTVLDGVDLTIRAGEMVALVGPSGAGKTTLVNLLPRFYDVTDGSILIDGLDVRQATLSSLRAQMALVTQETILFNDSIRNNIAYGNSLIPLDRVVAAARAAHAHEFIEAMSNTYETSVGERGTRLSAGQRQRLAIARAILKDAPILILDEATSALDPESEALVQDALERLLRGRTSIVIAHRLSTVRRADCIHVVANGRIVESGTHRELLARGGLYARLHRIQFREPVPTAGRAGT
jgi:subfamily B ATP-binding cassette protein MsbA